MLPFKEKWEEKLSKEPLSEEEIVELRKIIVKEKRMAWLWILIRNTAYWTAGAFLAIAVGWEKIVSVAKWIAGVK